MAAKKKSSKSAARKKKAAPPATGTAKVKHASVSKKVTTAFAETPTPPRAAPAPDKYAGSEVADQVVVSFKPMSDPSDADAARLHSALQKAKATVLRERSGMVQVKIAPEDRHTLDEALAPLDEWEVAAEAVARIPKS